MKRPTRFEEVIGHQHVIELMRTRLQEKTFPKFAILWGPPGCGKTTLAELIHKAHRCKADIVPCNHCVSCKEIEEKAIGHKQDVQGVFHFTCGLEDGGKAAMIDVVRIMQDKMDTSNKTIILDEAQRISSAAMDALLNATDDDYIPNNVILLMLTTDKKAIQDNLESRTVSFKINPLAPSEINHIMREEAKERNLIIQNPTVAFQIIGRAKGFKPRHCLQVLNFFGYNREVTIEDIKDYLSTLSITSALPLIKALNGDIVDGMHQLDSLNYDSELKSELINLLEEILRLRYKTGNYTMSDEDLRLITEETSSIPEELIVLFLYRLAECKELTRHALLAAFLATCKGVSKMLGKVDVREARQSEMEQKYRIESEAGVSSSDFAEMTAGQSKPMVNIEELLKGGKVING